MDNWNRIVDFAEKIVETTFQVDGFVNKEILAFGAEKNPWVIHNNVLMFSELYDAEKYNHVYR